MRYCPSTKEYVKSCGHCEMCPDEDMGEQWAEYKEERKEKKASNLEQSLELLANKGFIFTALSPHHYRYGIWDFWPSTGKYHNRETKVYSRGVFNLIKEIESNI